MGMAETDTRERLLGAACRVVAREGPARLTLDAVSAEARVSKGGVLYHFPNKHALLAAMVNQLIDAFEAEVARCVQSEPPGPGQWLRAYVHASVKPPDGEEDAVAAVLVAAFTEPTLLDAYRERARAWLAQATADGTDLVVARAVMYAADGIYMDDLFRTNPPTPAERAALTNQLITWASSASARPSASAGPQQAKRRPHPGPGARGKKVDPS
jgi:AcrR family transcriptional regulator